MQLKASVIIPHKDNLERLSRCLEALEVQSFPAGAFEIIVVDNGSSGNVREVLRPHRVRLLEEALIPSPYLCRNRGIREACGGYLVLLDSNCIPCREWLRAGIEMLETGRRDIVTGPVRFEFSPENTVFERLDYLYSVLREEDLPFRTALPATHLFIRREVFEEIGLFIPNIRSLGDIEWTDRAWRRGFRFHWAGEACVSYPSKDLRAFFRKMLRLGRGSKELWLSKGRVLQDPQWIWQVPKSFLPPNPVLVGSLRRLDRREKTGIGIFRLFWMAWLLKILRGTGRIFGKYHRKLAGML